MNLSSIALRAARSVETYAKRNAPVILTTAGVIGMVGTTVIVARSTLKAKPKFEKTKTDLREIENREITPLYTQQDRATDYGKVCISGTQDFVKLYGPSIVLGAASVFCIISAHGMMKQRQAALVAAYATLDQGFRAYRDRVREELGEDRETDFYRGIRTKTEMEMEEGGVCIVNDYGDDPRVPSPYGRFFDESTKNWTKTPEYNLMFLMSQQKYANDRLRAHGYVFLNEVYESLGFDRTQAGQIVGWRLDGNGDGFVSFGIHDIADECNRAFVNGLEHTVLLDFNVDGPIQI